MTDHQLLITAEAHLTLAARLINTGAITHSNIIKARDLTQAALSHLQGLENRFRQGLITNDTPPSVTVS